MTDKRPAQDLKPAFPELRDDARIIPRLVEDLCGSAELDDEFIAKFEACEFPKERWRHADHLRLAWCYLRRYNATEAEARIVRSLRAYTISLGLAHKYHETMTRAWLRLVAVAAAVMPRDASFEATLIENRWLLEKQRLNIFYSPARLESGRSVWIEPDLAALPSANGAVYKEHR